MKALLAVLLVFGPMVLVVCFKAGFRAGRRSRPNDPWRHYR